MKRDRENPLSSGVVVVRRINHVWHFLLLRAYQYWDFPKGLVESGEQPLEGAQREVMEETSLTGLHFRWGYEYRETPPYGKLRKIARYYIAESSEGDVELLINPEIGRPEHEEFRWVSLDQAEKMLSPRVQPVLAWAASVLAE